METAMTRKLPGTVKPSTRAQLPTAEEMARAMRRAKALRSKTVMAIYLVLGFSVVAAIGEMRGRAAAQVAARPTPRHAAPTPSVAAPAPVVEAPRARGPVAPAPPGAPAPWGGWIG